MGAHSVMRRLRERSGIARIHWHLFRHGFAQHAQKNGVDVGEVQEMLGHTTNVMTRRCLGQVKQVVAARKMPRFSPNQASRGFSVPLRVFANVRCRAPSPGQTASTLYSGRSQTTVNGGVRGAVGGVRPGGNAFHDRVSETLQLTGRILLGFIGCPGRSDRGVPARPKGASQHAAARRCASASARLEDGPGACGYGARKRRVSVAS